MQRSTRILGAGLAVVLAALGGRASALPPLNDARIDEVLAGANGDSRVQFIELIVKAPGGVTLAFYDGAGRETGQFRLPGRPPLGTKLLVATSAFAALPGAPHPDFKMPPMLNAVSGKVCLALGPDGPQMPRGRRCVSYGKFASDVEGGVLPAPALPLTDTQSLVRVRDAGDSSDYVLSRRPSPTNAARATFTMPIASVVRQGETLFDHETFQGNGRTCASCHVRGDGFSLRPETVRQKFASLAQGSYDPLFIAETVNFDFNLNTLTLAAAPRPGDLSGILQGTTGRAKVLARTSPTTYLVYGGLAPVLSGTVTDGVNTATVASVVAGDLDQLESPRMMRLGLGSLPQPDRFRRTLITENIDGFDRPAVFRKSPHLLNLRFTAPYGLSGEFADLRAFSQGAIAQHFPRRLAREAGVDFRPATDDELKALEAFQLSLESPAGNDPDKFDLDRFTTTTRQREGRAIFFGPVAKCSRCHNGLLLNQTDGSVGKPAGPATFNTGVSRAEVNERDEVPGEPGRDGRLHAREFDIPSLFNLEKVKPLFHDASFAEPVTAITFYGGFEFNDSPGGIAVGGISLGDRLELLNPLNDFLASLTERPYTLTGPVKFDDQVAGQGPGAPREIVVTNTSSEPVRFLRTPRCGLTGPDAAEFAVVECPLELQLLPGASRTLKVAFAPTSAGPKRAVFEVGSIVPSGVDLSGEALPPIVTSDRR